MDELIINYDLFIFDLDDTIVMTELFHNKAWNITISKELNKENIDKVISHINTLKVKLSNNEDLNTIFAFDYLSMITELTLEQNERIRKQNRG